MCHYVDLASDGSGGLNDFTRPAREDLAVAQRAMDDCVRRYGSKRS
jgi:hypothetical protein